MIGDIESYDVDTRTGVIKSDGRYIAFHVDDWLPQVPPEQGDDVSFELKDDGAATHVDLVGAYLTTPKPVKYKYLAGILGLLLGVVGAHRLYLGFYKMALVQLVLFLLTHGYSALWGFIEGILILGGQINKDAKGRPLK